MTPPAVAIVGLPNVGKSTLFNRLVGRRRALVGSEPGVTRDRLHAEVELASRRVVLIDTGGIFARAGEGLGAQVRAQAEIAVAEATVILFVVSARDGARPEEKELAAFLRASGRPVLLVANKVDHGSVELLLGDLYRLGLGDPLAISAEHGRGMRALEEAVAARLPEEEGREEETDPRALAIVGRPNVGKSSLLNALVREERVIVDEAPGTTRDSVDLVLEVGEHRYRVIDTAGIRRGARRDRLEHLGTLQATRSLAGASMALLVLDGSEGITAQDLSVAGLARQHHRPFVTVVNKWDRQPPGDEPRAVFLAEIRRRLRFAPWAPTVFVSARTGAGLPKIFRAVEEVWENSGTRIGAGRLNRFLARIQDRHTGRDRKGAPVRPLYMAQKGTHPPRFVVFMNSSQPVHFTYRRYLENRLREEFALDRTPIVMEWRKR